MCSVTLTFWGSDRLDKVNRIETILSLLSCTSLRDHTMLLSFSVSRQSQKRILLTPITLLLYANKLIHYCVYECFIDYISYNKTRVDEPSASYLSTISVFFRKLASSLRVILPQNATCFLRPDDYLFPARFFLLISL